MANDLELKIRIRAELDQFRKQLDSVSDALGQTDDDAADAAKGLDALQRELDGVGASAEKTGKALDKVVEAENKVSAARRKSKGADDTSAKITGGADGKATASAAKEEAAAQKAAAQAARQKASEAEKLARAQERERASAQALADDLQHQAKAYGLAGSSLLELNKKRDISKIKTDAERRSVSAAYDELIRKAKQAEKEQSKASGAMAGAMGKAATAVTGFLTAYSAIAALKGIANVTDEYSQLSAQLKITTKSQEDFKTAQEEVYRIAQATRSPMATVAGTYATLQRSTEKLGKSQSEITGVLETVNKSIALTSPSADSAAAALTQFGQALSGDFKNGSQELNSILEQTPGLAIAIADGLGVATADLKKMGEQGELSAGLVFAALQKMATQVDEKFKLIPLTVSGAMTQLQNDVVKTFGQIDVSPLTGAIEDLRKTLTDPGIAEGLSTLAGGLVRIVGLAAEAGAGIAKFGEVLAFAAADMTGYATELDELGIKLKIFKSMTSGTAGGTALRAALFYTEDAAKAEEARIEARIRQIRGLKDIPDEAKAGAAGADSKKTLEQIKAEGDAALEAERKKATKKKADEESAKLAEQRKKQLADMTESLKQEAETYGKSAADIARYNAAQLGASVEEQNRVAAIAGRIEAMERATETEKESAAESKRLIEERKREEEKLAADMLDIRIRLMRSSGDIEGARAAELSAQYDPIIEQLKAKSKQAGIEIVEKLINLEKTESQLDAVKEKISAALTDLSTKEQSVDARVTTGDTPKEAGNQEIEAARAKAIEQLRELRIELAELANQGAPGAAAALAELDAEIEDLSNQGGSGAGLAIKNLTAQLDELQRMLVSNIASSAVDGLAENLMAIADGSKSAKDGIKDFARDFVRSIAQMIAKAIALQAVLAVLNMIPGGAAVASLVGAGVKHRGGIAGGGGQIRTVPAFVFAAAPRYHAGGIAGLQPGEVPAILQRGEEVLTRSDPRHAANQSTAQGAGTRIINVIDPNMVADYMSSSSGEQTFLNVIQRNSGLIKQVLI
jgi:tape measure domain-containing protein